MILGPLNQVLFSDRELACRETGMIVLATGFAEALRALRLDFGQPMAVTSCCRSKAHNDAIRGHPRSLHVYDEPNHGADGTLAIDIGSQDGVYRRLLIHLALQKGWSVGSAKTFIHLDRRDFVGLQPVEFGYGS